MHSASQFHSFSMCLDNNIPTNDKYTNMYWTYSHLGFYIVRCRRVSADLCTCVLKTFYKTFHECTFAYACLRTTYAILKSTSRSRCMRNRLCYGASPPSCQHFIKNGRFVVSSNNFSHDKKCLRQDCPICSLVKLRANGLHQCSKLFSWQHVGCYKRLSCRICRLVHSACMNKTRWAIGHLYWWLPMIFVFAKAFVIDILFFSDHWSQKWSLKPKYTAPNTSTGNGGALPAYCTESCLMAYREPKVGLD